MSEQPAAEQSVRNSLFYFNPEDAGDVFVSLTPEGKLEWETGIKPNVWAFRVPHTELAKLQGRLYRTGSVNLCDTDPELSDVVLSKWRIVACQPLAYETVIVGGEPARRYTEWRLHLADWRIQMVEPRGGRLAVGHVNPKKPSKSDAADEGKGAVKLTFEECLRKCLDACGFSGTQLPDAVQSLDPPEDLKWFGSHAPTELEKLLKAGRLIFAPQTDGTPRICAVGVGDEVQFREGDAYRSAAKPIVDLRGDSVVFTSYPTRVVVTKTLVGPAVDSWQFVVPDPDHGNKLLPVSGPGAAINGGLPEALRKGFPDNVSNSSWHAMETYAYRMIQIYGGSDRPPTPISPVLARCFNKDGQDDRITLLAPVANWDRNLGVWRNSTEQTRVPVLQVRGDDLLITNFVGAVSPDLSSDRLRDFKEIADQSAKLVISYEDAEDPGDGVWSPRYFTVGYTRDKSGAVKEMADDEVANAMAGSDAVIFTRPELLLRVHEGDEVNRQELHSTTLALAQQYFARPEQATPAQMAARGYQYVELDGLVSKVTWDPESFSTEVEQLDWWSATAELSPLRVVQREAAEAYPNQATKAAERSGLGTAGDRGPVLPLEPPGGQPVPPAQVFPVLCSVDGGAAGSSATSCTWTYSLFSPMTGKPLTTLGGDVVKLITPVVPRLPLVEYARPADKSIGLAYRDQEGSTKLYHVAAEFPKAGDC